MKTHVEVDVQLHTFLTKKYMHISDFLHHRPLYPLPQTNGGQWIYCWMETRTVTGAANYI